MHKTTHPPCQIHDQVEQILSQKFLSDRQVAARYGVTRTSIWRWLKTLEAFPEPIKLSEGCSRWTLLSLLNWEHKCAERQKGGNNG